MKRGIFMNKATKKAILVILVTVAVLTAFVTLSYFSEKTKLNPAGIVGNLAGNLNNAGYFCEYDGTVYFANSYAGGSLFAMTPDEQKLRRLNKLNVRNILAGGEYLYYFQLGAAEQSTGFGYVRNVRSFSRTDLDGRNAKSLSHDIIITAQLVNNDIYMLAAGAEHPSFYKVKIDKSAKKDLADYQINPACAADGTIYYNGTQGDHNLYRLNTANDTSEEILAGNIWYPILQGDFIYYMDVENNYRLCRYSLSQNQIEVLTKERVDTYNVGYGYIYCQTSGKAPQLICMREDGSNAFVLAEGTFRNINLTSMYVYFQEFGNDAGMLHSPLGSTYYEDFSAARDFVIKEK